MWRWKIATMSVRDLGRLLLRLLGRAVLGALVVVGGFFVAGVGLILNAFALIVVTKYLQGHPWFLPATPEIRALLTTFEHTSRSLKLGETATIALPPMTEGATIEILDGWEFGGPHWLNDDRKRVAVWRGYAIDRGPNEIGLFHFQGKKLVGFARVDPCDLDAKEVSELNATYRFVRVECRPPKLSDPWRRCTPQWNRACALTIVGAE